MSRAVAVVTMRREGVGGREMTNAQVWWWWDVTKERKSKDLALTQRVVVKTKGLFVVGWGGGGCVMSRYEEGFLCSSECSHGDWE